MISSFWGDEKRDLDLYYDNIKLEEWWGINEDQISRLTRLPHDSNPTYRLKVKSQVRCHLLELICFIHHITHMGGANSPN